MKHKHIGFIGYLVLLLLAACPEIFAQETTLEKLVSGNRKYGISKTLNKIKQNKFTGEDADFASELLRINLIKDSISADSARKKYDALSTRLPKISSEIIKCEFYFSDAECDLSRSDYPSAIKKFEDVYLFAKSKKLASYRHLCAFFLANALTRINNHIRAVQYCKEAYEASIGQMDTIQIIRSVNLLCVNYLYICAQEGNEQKYRDSILNVVESTRKYCLPANYRGQALLAISKAYAYDCTGESEKFVMCSKDAYRFWIKTGDTANMISTTNTLIYALLNRSENDSALHYLNKISSWVNSSPRFLKKDRRSFFYNYYRAYRGARKPDSALHYLELWYKQDSTFNVEKNVILQKQEKEFNDSIANMHLRDERDKDKALYEQKKNYLLFIVVLIAFVLISVFAGVIWRVRQKKEKEKMELENILHRAELSALKAQMNPHFIFNALNSVQHLIISNKPEEAYRALAKFSKLIRNILDHSIETLISLELEIETLKLYTEIESRRFDGSFQHTIEIEGRTGEMGKFRVPPMMVQPYVENAIWHGLMNKEGEKKLRVIFNIVSEKELVVSVFDNGMGMKSAENLKDTSNKTHVSRGMKNIYDRVKLLEQTHNIKIVTETGNWDDPGNNTPGTAVKITFKFNKAV